MIETMDAAAVRREWVGSFVAGRFPLLQWLGGSEAAGVFLTERHDPAAKATIKLIPADNEDADARVAAWEAAAALSHSNLMEVYAHGSCEIDGAQYLYVVTEFADEVLAEIVRERPLTTDETRDMLGPVFDALSYLHSKGLVHSGIRPSNIMAAGDRLKLSTDGLSFAEATARFSATRTIYDAPETVNGTIGPAADLWSLGATLVEVLTQRPPEWNGSETSDPMVPQSVPQPFSAIARRCLRADPARRSTVEAFQARLDLTNLEPARPNPANLEPAGLDPAKASTDQEVKADKKTPAGRRIALLLAVTAVVLAGVGIWNALSHRKQPPAETQQAQVLPAATPAQAPAPAPAASPDATSVEAPAPTEASAPPTAPNAPSAPTQAQPPVTAPAPVPAAAPPPQAEAQPQTASNPAPVATMINPAIMSQILPDIVPSALKTINGTLRVSVELTLGPDGFVTGATLQSPGPSKYFAGKSLEAARHWKFKPAQVNSPTAPSNWILEFQYTRSGIHVVTEQTAP
jgi:eukaryotic-like serine/threonine-protein kinase